MSVIAIATLLQAANPIQAPAPDCMGTLVQFGNGESRALVSFWVSGSPAQLSNISEAAKKIGVIAQPPKTVDGKLVLFVFFENSVNGFQAFQLVNDVFKGLYHPGVPKDEIKKEAMFLSPSTLKNCKN